MPLLKTTIDDNHYHIAYYVEGKGGITSLNDGHRHDIIMTSDQEGQIIYGASPSEDMSHVHGLEPYVPKELGVQFDGSDEKTLGRVYDRYQTARALEEDAIRDGAYAEKFLQHDQWDKQLKNELTEKKTCCDYGKQAGRKNGHVVWIPASEPYRYSIFTDGGWR